LFTCVRCAEGLNQLRYEFLGDHVMSLYTY
jgi:hypothetical protein